MGQINLLRRRAAPLGMAFVLSLGLYGCIAAVAPLMPLIGAGMAAFSGFEMYKSVQLAGGGSVDIEFPGKDGKTNPPQSIAPVRRVAVWPGDEGDVHFAERLQSSGKFSVVIAPASVSRILSEAKQPADLKQMTEQEQGEAFEAVCHRGRVDLVFGARPLGASTDTNAFSFSRANVTYKADLLGYSCTMKTIVWRDQIALVVNLGGSVPNTGEMNKAASDAWADRVFEAMGGPPAKRTAAS